MGVGKWTNSYSLFGQKIIQDQDSLTKMNIKVCRKMTAKEQPASRAEPLRAIERSAGGQGKESGVRVESNKRDREEKFWKPSWGHHLCIHLNRWKITKMIDQTERTR